MMELTGIKALKTSKQAALEALAYIDGRRLGEIKSLITPWKAFNEAHIDGIEPKRIITIGGMSSSGKSAISAQIERDLFALNPHEEFSVLSFNFEMPSMDIVMRNVIANKSIDNRALLSADGIMLDKVKFDGIKLYLENEVSKLRIYYVEYPQTVEEYAYIMKLFANTVKTKFISIADHSILFKKGVSDKNVNDLLYSLGETSIKLKKELNVTQIHLTQLNREIEAVARRVPQNAFNYPTKDCLFGADALYQAADTVLINHKPSLLNFPKKDGYGSDKLRAGDNDLYWHFIKLRQGSPHIASMTADFARMRVVDRDGGTVQKKQLNMALLERLEKA